MPNTTKRPTIPPQVQRELWARSAGRCEFRGCNELLYKDSLTQQRSNLAKVSHIVAFSPDGPRGHPTRSKELEKEISNLMLTCHDHGKVVDDKDKEEEYPENLLLEFKREHEDRIRLLTEITEESQTHVLLLQVPIDGSDVHIDPKAASRAILPKYPAEEKPYRIELNSMRDSAASEEVFRVLAGGVIERTEKFLEIHRGHERVKNLSVFALAPIPLLVAFGHRLGDIECVDLYQRHRQNQDWSWPGDEDADVFYDVVTPEAGAGEDQPVVLALSISNIIQPGTYPESFRAQPLVYEIRAKNPGLDFLSSRMRVQMFGVEVRKLLTELREKYEQERVIHVLAAAPAPIAIELGRNIRQYDAPYKIYEFEKTNRMYFPALTVNALRKERP